MLGDNPLVANWGIPVAAFADAQANPEKISGKMTTGNNSLLLFCAVVSLCVVCISVILLVGLHFISLSGDGWLHLQLFVTSLLNYAERCLECSSFDVLFSVTIDIIVL